MIHRVRFIINSFIEDYLHPTRQDGSPGCDTSEHSGTGTRARSRHWATVFGFTPWCRASTATGSRELWNSALVLAVVVALPCKSCAIVPPSSMARKLHHDTLGLHR
jgi:hypothetical protein